MSTDHATASPFVHDVATVQALAVVPRILDVICRTTGMGFAAVARVTEQHWIACAVRDDIGFGLQPGGQLALKTTICDGIRQSNTRVVIDRVAGDAHFSRHPAPAQYGFQSYISVPLRFPDGRFFGTLCAIDPRPARVNNPETIGMFEMFADLIGFHLDSAERLAISEQTLAHIREDAGLREQFIAILGHDLRNPLAAIHAGASVLAAAPLPPIAARALKVVEASTARMIELVNNVVDLARGRMGGGLPLVVKPVDLAAVFEQVRNELSFGPQRIELDVQLTAAVHCDEARMAQLLSNLVGNALTHGDTAYPVRVRARTADEFEVVVQNRGTPIAPARLATLFHPFARAAAASPQAGLGLGLYIASEIARAHGGTLTASSDDNMTEFMLRMPMTRLAAVQAT